MIPRIVHFVWLGSPLPTFAQETIESWRKYHPNWEMRLWHDDNLPVLANQATFDEAPTWSQKSDVLRFEFLLNFGGIYADTDAVCLRNFDRLIEGLQCFAGSQDEGCIATGLFGSVPGTPLLKRLVQRLPWNFAACAKNDAVGSTGPYFFMNNFNAMVERKYTHMDCWHNPDRCPFMRVFPPEYFYPTHYTGRIYGPMSEAYATHLWKQSWS